MLSFAAPFVFLILPAPFVVWWFAPPHREQAQALRVPFFHSIAAAAGQTPSQGSVVRRRGRWQMIVFGSKAYLQTPFTEDLEGASELMAQTEVGMAGPHTAMGDAIGLALRTFETSETEQKFLVLLSDGADTNSQMSPLNATEIAANAGVRIYTIGVGDPAASGDNRVDLVTLQAIAERADGGFYVADDTEGLREIYAEIDRLNPRLVDTTTFQPKETMGHYVFAAALWLGLVLLAGLMLASGRSAEHG